LQVSDRADVRSLLVLCAVIRADLRAFVRQGTPPTPVFLRVSLCSPTGLLFSVGFGGDLR
jgi:hypothetical protein